MAALIAATLLRRQGRTDLPSFDKLSSTFQLFVFQPRVALVPPQRLLEHALPDCALSPSRDGNDPMQRPVSACTADRYSSIGWFSSFLLSRVEVFQGVHGRQGF